MSAVTLPAARSSNVRIAFLLCCGVMASAQIGKAIVAIPLIRTDFTIGVGLAGLIVAMFATLGAAAGVVAGAKVRQMGSERALILGMLAIGAGNFAGAVAPNEFILLAARIVEGVGFFGVVLAIPSMLSAIARPKDRDFVMGIWSAYMPAGITLMLFLGPLAAASGWRSLWLLNGMIATSFGLLAWAIAPRVRPLDRPSNDRLLAGVLAILREPKCVLLALTFFLYACQIFSMLFALPLLLTSAGAMGVGKAGLLSAGVMAISTIGHISGGALLRAGVPIWMNIAAAFAVYAGVALVIYAITLPPSAIVLLTALALGVGGLAPAAIYASAPQVVPDAGQIAPMIGLIQQASNLGQFMGPVALGFWVQVFGWSSAAPLVATAAIMGLVFAVAIRGVMLAKTV